MKNFTLAFNRAVFFSLLFWVAGATPQALAQTPGSGGPTPQDPTPTTDVPLDGGASLLLAGGVGYGLRRLRRKK